MKQSRETTIGKDMKAKGLTRRDFLQHSLAIAAGAPLALSCGRQRAFAAESLAGPTLAKAASTSARSNARVAIVNCRSYGPEVGEAMRKCLALLGGIGSLVKNKTVTVKLNLTANNFTPYMDRPVGETYMTHYA